MKFEMVRQDGKPPELCAVSKSGNPLRSLQPAEIGQNLHDVITGYLVNQDSIEIDNRLFVLLMSEFKQLAWDLNYSKEKHLEHLRGAMDKLEKIGKEEKGILLKSKSGK